MATNSISSSPREVTLVGSEHLYFFPKAYEDYIAAPSTDTISRSLSAAENELNITHSDDFSLILSRCAPSKNVKINPFETAPPISLQTYLREQGIQYKSGRPYVDLCVILGEHNLAVDFAKTHQKDYDILHIPKGKDGAFDYVAAVREVILEAQPSARLTSLIYRAVGQCQEQYSLVIAELFSLGFHWDAYCLAKLRYPDAFFTSDMARRLQQVLSPVEPSAVRSSPLEDMLKSVKSGLFVEYHNSLLQDEDPLQLYRLLKCLIMKNEQGTDESRKLNGRMKAAATLRQLILITVVKVGPTEAVAMLGDMLVFLKTKPSLLGDFFNLKERMMIEKCVAMIGAVYSAIGRASITHGSEKNQVLVKEISDSWLMYVPGLWKAESANRDALKDLGSSLGHSLSSIEKCFVAPYKDKAAFLKHSIMFLCDLVGSPSASALDMDGPAEQKFTKIVDNLGLRVPTTPRRPQIDLKKLPNISVRGSNETDESMSGSAVYNLPPCARVDSLDELLRTAKPIVPINPRYPAETRMEFKTGGFEIQDSQSSNFGKWPVRNQNSFPSNIRGYSNGNQPFRGNDLNKSFSGAQQSNSYRGGNGHYRGPNLNSSFAAGTSSQRNGNGNGSFRGGDNLNKTMYCGNA